MRIASVKLLKASGWRHRSAWMALLLVNVVSVGVLLWWTVAIAALRSCAPKDPKNDLEEWCREGETSACFKLGAQYAGRGDEQKARAYLQPLCDNGDDFACHELWYFFEYRVAESECAKDGGAHCLEAIRRMRPPDRPGSPPKER